MTAHPFLTVPLREKKDALRARRCARRVAALLQFPPQEQSCIAAGAFAVAWQALSVLDQPALCFELADGRLHVYANPRQGHGAVRLVKRLPDDPPFAEADLAWLAQQADMDRLGVFDEIVRQNDEVLTLLHALAEAHARANAPEPLRIHAA